MEDKDKREKVRERIKQLAELQARQQDSHPTLPDEEKLFRKVFESANDGIIIHDRAGQIYEVNQTMYRRLGYTREEMLSMSLEDLVAPGFSEKIQERVGRLEQEGVAIFESADVRKDGTILPVEVSARIIEYDGLKLIQSIVRDIHERKTAEILIQHALEEREILQGEIKHRVLVHHDLCIAGLESLKQQGNAGLPAETLESQVRRIKALGYIQSRIYSSKNVRKIEFAKIASALVKHLQAVYAVDASRIRCTLDIHDVFMDIRKTTSCAQILIELVGNAFSHAFPADHGGNVHIAMSRDEDEGYTLSVGDDGIGASSAQDAGTSTGLGMRLVGDLVAHLSGHLSLDNSKGIRVVIRFP